MSWIVILFIAAVGIAAAVGNARNTSGSGHSGGHHSGGHSGRSRRAGTLIEHLHFCARSDYECSVCGNRFRDNARTCPYCGAVFVSTLTDRREYDAEEEEDEDDWWDEQMEDR